MALDLKFLETPKKDKFIKSVIAEKRAYNKVRQAQGEADLARLLRWKDEQGAQDEPTVRAMQAQFAADESRAKLGGGAPKPLKPEALDLMQGQVPQVNAQMRPQAKPLFPATSDIGVGGPQGPNQAGVAPGGPYRAPSHRVSMRATEGTREIAYPEGIVHQVPTRTREVTAESTELNQYQAAALNMQRDQDLWERDIKESEMELTQAKTQAAVIGEIATSTNAPASVAVDVGAALMNGDAREAARLLKDVKTTGAAMIAAQDAIARANSELARQRQVQTNALLTAQNSNVGGLMGFPSVGSMFGSNAVGTSRPKLKSIADAGLADALKVEGEPEKAAALWEVTGRYAHAGHILVAPEFEKTWSDTQSYRTMPAQEFFALMGLAHGDVQAREPGEREMLTKLSRQAQRRLVKLGVAKLEGGRIVPVDDGPFQLASEALFQGYLKLRKLEGPRGRSIIDNSLASVAGQINELLDPGASYGSPIPKRSSEMTPEEAKARETAAGRKARLQELMSTRSGLQRQLQPFARGGGTARTRSKQEKQIQREIDRIDRALRAEFPEEMKGPWQRIQDWRRKNEQRIVREREEILKQAQGL
jgi:hypothetical protein